MRLSSTIAGRLPANVARPTYDRDTQSVGIVHFGIGAFHRAHMAWYTDLTMGAGDRNWAITGVSLRSPDVARQMNPQDGLYTVTERSGGVWASRLIGAVRNVLVASEQRENVIEILSSPDTRIVSFTVTEKGYCRAADGTLDAELTGSMSFYAYLAVALRRRHDAGLHGLTLLSCDNLADNGLQLARLMAEYLDRHDPALAQWFTKECRCPSTMVDRIVPATTAGDRAAIECRIGLTDDAAVMTEPFSQWVIEDHFAGPRPRWEGVGAELVADVRPYETAKLRMLNGAHSLLAYVGLAHGHHFVHQAVADREIRPLVESLLREEAPLTIAPAAGQDLSAYADALLVRFANPALEHRLIQIAMDGSQKISQRWLATLSENQRMKRRCPAILAGLGAWLLHVRGDECHARGEVSDPLANDLTTCWQRSGNEGIVDAVFGERGLLASKWRPTNEDRMDIQSLF